MATTKSDTKPAGKADPDQATKQAAVDQAKRDEEYAEAQREEARKAEAKAQKQGDDLKRGDGIIAIQDPSQPMANPPKLEELAGEPQTAYSEK